MQSLFVIGLSALVFVHRLSRFRNLAADHDPSDIPCPTSAVTTSLNYWGGAVIYGAIFVLAYRCEVLYSRQTTFNQVDL